ncbi:phage tail protein [Polaribacter sp. ALD11]|uniref:phage tail protein n=1 Tax=Polaribacter sp. ALD11 TaxID=2058137 RepID=UPI000C2FFA71|nr:tail fiber protein [Polaribacter sp. ALD11]AUC85940.1 phage tail protein [Polaribacter sp. ALD11]
MKLKIKFIALLFICLLSNTEGNAQDTPLIGEIKIFAGNFAPRGWAYCDGQLLSISQNQALFAILGTTYGGDGRTSFALPDLRGRVAIGPRNGPGLPSYKLGQRGGAPTNKLTILEMPSHNHLTSNSAAADQHAQLSTKTAVNETPQAGDVPAIANIPASLGVQNVKSFGPPAAGSVVNGQTLSGNADLTILNNGGSQAHNIMQPYLTINYIIALVGIFPSRN